MPVDPYTVCARSPDQAALYLGALSSLPPLPSAEAEVLAALAARPLIPWDVRPDPLIVVPGALLLLVGTVRIPFAGGAAAAAKLVGLAVLHGNPPDQVIAWTAFEQGVSVGVDGAAYVGTLSVLVARQT